MHYVQVNAAQDLPSLSALGPFKAIVIADEPLAADRRDTISHWLVESGCLYLMAWGYDSADWAASAERVNRAAHDTEEIPDDRLVIATSHEDESLDQVCWFAKYTAMHPCAELHNCVLVHIGDGEREGEIATIFTAA